MNKDAFGKLKRHNPKLTEQDVFQAFHEADQAIIKMLDENINMLDASTDDEVLQHGKKAIQHSKDAANAIKKLRV